MKRLTIFQFKAIIYADIFEYPLVKQELDKFKIQSSNDKTSSKSNIKIQNKVEKKGEYYFLKGREELVKYRKERKVYSKAKLQVAQKAAQLLRIIPSILMIAVTGALAMNNATRNDDIDLLIVTSKGRIWLTRLLATILFEMCHMRRRPYDTKWNDKICLNMFVDERHLQVPKKEQDLFSGHEAAQIKVLWSRGDIEKQWWRENEWIGRYLPNFKFQMSNVKSSSKFKLVRKKIFKIWILAFIWILDFGIWNFIEELFKKIQLSYMQSKLTKEVITDGYLRFHPYDARGWVMREYNKRLRRYGLR